MNKDKLYDDVLDSAEKIMNAMKALLTEEPDKEPEVELSDLAVAAAKKADVSACCAFKVLKAAAELLEEGREDG